MLALQRLLGDPAPFNPTLVGTYPLELPTSRSDFDILWCSDDLAHVERALAATLLELGLTHASPRPLAPPASLTPFECSGMSIEVFCKPPPVTAQHGFTASEAARLFFSAP